jgi:hypothetical protein
MSNIYLYFYKNGNGSNFFFHDSKEFLDSLGCFDALISEVDLAKWQSDAKNYPNPQFPLPSYIIEGFKSPMYQLLKESADLAYDDLTKKSLKASVALFTLDNLYRVTVPGQDGLGVQLPIEYTKEDYEEYDDFLQELREIKKSFNCLSKLLKTINNIDDLYEFKHSVLPSGQAQRFIKNINCVKKELSKDDKIDNDSDFNTINSDSDLSTKGGFTSDSDEN